MEKKLLFPLFNFPTSLIFFIKCSVDVGERESGSSALNSECGTLFRVASSADQQEGLVGVFGLQGGSWHVLGPCPGVLPPQGPLTSLTSLLQTCHHLLYPVTMPKTRCLSAKTPEQGAGEGVAGPAFGFSAGFRPWFIHLDVGELIRHSPGPSGQLPGTGTPLPRPGQPWFC